MIRRYSFAFSEIESIEYRSLLGHHVAIVPRRGISIYSAGFRRAEHAAGVVAELARDGAPMSRSALEFARPSSPI